ncbi:hypothetical protein WS63_19055 [Burkholderia stagnalis]|uniref:hypothetical protein n=1 Tax=Burkholderia stagnalis TaxID=1503054 RepID=UPI000753D4EE|nr:hypothetical protein [Burkholderia stagnalis]KVD87189.1 hypothetical protein WS63_19055 [Burkholderia stagnalis]
MAIKATSYSGGTYHYPVRGRDGSRNADGSVSAGLSLSDLLKRNEEARVALSNIGRSSAQSAKEYARRRLEEIEEMLRQLAMLGLSPKQLAAIIKEVKGLVAQYRDAGKALGGDVSGASPAVSGDGGNTNGMAADDGASEAAASTDAATAVASVAAGDPSTARDAISPSDILSQPGAGRQESPANAYLAMAGNLSRTNDADTADAKFMVHANGLLERLKAMLKHAQREAAHISPR